jgi:hypothetical protein
MGKDGEENGNLRRIWNHCNTVYKQTTVLEL